MQHPDRSSGFLPILLPHTVTVSGYPPVQTVLWAEGGHLLLAATNSADVHAFVARQQQILASVTGTNGRRARCECCKRWRPRADLRGAEMGLVNRFCAACVARFRAACFAKHGRFPTADELWCAGCERIVSREHQARPEADRRTRLRCRDCRRAQWRKSDRRRRLRAGLDVRPGSAL